MAIVRRLLSLLLLLASVPLWAQEPSQPVRLELPLNVDETYAEVIPVPDSSLLLYYKISNIWGNKSSFHFIKYDPKLEETWSASADLKPDQYYIRSYTEAPFTYLVFGELDPQKYTVVRVNLVRGETAVQHLELEMLEAIYEFRVLQGRYFVIGKGKNDVRPLLLYINPASKEIKPLPAIYDDESSFSDLLADPAHERMDVVIAESNGRIARLQVKSFNASGELIRNRFILPQQNRSLLNAEVTPGDSLSKLLIGTYGTRDTRYSQGFFTTSALSELGPNRFYSLLQLKNFLKYMKPRREERIRRRETARQQAGKEPGYHYRLLLHDLITTSTGYVVAAEVYYPQFRDNTFNGINRTIGVRRGPEGFKHTQVVALGFDREGTLLWDNSFPLKDLITPTLTHAVELGYSPDGRLVAAYPDEEEIVYRVMHEDKYTDEDTSLKVLTYSKADKIIDTNEESIAYWYGNYFVAFGFQRINSPEGFRNVFYINKIGF